MLDYNQDLIKIKNKYYLFKYNKKVNKISLITKGNTKQYISESSKGKKINIENEILLVKLEKTEWKPDTKIPINMLGGPIKITFQFNKISNRGVIRKVDDSRDIRYLFYTYDYYLKHKIKTSDIKKVAFLCYQDKLEKRPLAPKLINQIEKV